MQGLVVGNGTWRGLQNRNRSSCVGSGRSLHVRLHTRPLVHRRYGYIGYIGIGRRTVLQLREVRVLAWEKFLMREFSVSCASQGSIRSI